MKSITKKPLNYPPSPKLTKTQMKSTRKNLPKITFFNAILTSKPNINQYPDKIKKRKPQKLTSKSKINQNPNEITKRKPPLNSLFHPKINLQTQNLPKPR